tara:strand:+ start:351 stop:458 length:108 start_codon:yes stop_codon:yes gene_type:complete
MGFVQVAWAMIIGPCSDNKEVLGSLPAVFDSVLEM